VGPDAGLADAADATTHAASDADAGTEDGPVDTFDALPPLADASDGSASCACSASGMYPTNVSCSGLLGLLCGSTAGFTGTPACGQAGQFVTCKLSVVCGGTYSTRIQGCKP
jgi:hypothetical protein